MNELKLQEMAKGYISEHGDRAFDRVTLLVTWALQDGQRDARGPSGLTDHGIARFAEAARLVAVLKWIAVLNASKE